ncbi:helix-turn-helix domain-containing protein [Nocardia callitridis]|uniref:Helix-turn-helix transcriptional regulator n=1 Tax=Nocardia callitridis TaxID=648753 RepID=A0ABP9KSG1_9NOCA
MPHDVSRASLPRRQLGRFIRRQREENTTLPQSQVAAAMQWSHSRYSRLERGEPGKVLDRDLVELGSILDIEDDQVAVMIELARQVAEKTWYNSYNDLIRSNFDVYMRLETEAHSMQIFRPDVVPGLFQTSDYSRTLDRIFFPTESAEEQDRRAELKLRRQRNITRKRNPLTADLVLHESVLHTRVGNDAIMSAQLRRLADLSTQPNLTVQILPFKAGFPTGTPVGPFFVLDFEPGMNTTTSSSLVYTETYTGAIYLEEEADLSLFRKAMAEIQCAALDHTASRNLIRQVARKDPHQ